MSQSSPVQPSLNANIHALAPVRFLNPNYDHHRAGSDGLGAWQSSVTECLLTQWQIMSIFISTSLNFEHHGAPDFHARPSRFRFQSTHKCPTRILYTGFLAVGFLNDVEYPSFRCADGKRDRSHPRPTRTHHSCPTTTRARQREASGI